MIKFTSYGVSEGEWPGAKHETARKDNGKFCGENKNTTYDL